VNKSINKALSCSFYIVEIFKRGFINVGGKNLKNLLYWRGNKSDGQEN
jgi:hypothetical protein